MEKLDLDTERAAITDILTRHLPTKRIRARFEVATVDSFKALLTAYQIKANASSLQVVFVSSCHSEPVAKVFEQVGVPHIVAVHSDSRIVDASAKDFAKHFYLSLFAGKTVCTGAPGIGKSSLALAAAHYILQRRVCPDGVYYVDLEGLELSARCLLVLDKVEELLDVDEDKAQAWLGQLVACATNTRFLFASRRAPVIPNVTLQHFSINELSATLSESLLRMCNPQCTVDEARSLAQICGYLPLALRVIGRALANTRSNFTAQNLIERLQEGRLERFAGLPNAGEKECIDRCIRSSFTHLPPTLQLAFMALGLFRGGFDKAAATAVLQSVSTLPGSSIGSSGPGSLAKSLSEPSIRSMGTSRTLASHRPSLMMRSISGLNELDHGLVWESWSDKLQQLNSLLEETNEKDDVVSSEAYLLLTLESRDERVATELDVTSADKALETLNHWSLLERVTVPRKVAHMPSPNEPSYVNVTQYRLHSMIQLFAEDEASRRSLESPQNHALYLTWRRRFVRHYYSILTRASCNFRLLIVRGRFMVRVRLDPRERMELYEKAIQLSQNARVLNCSCGHIENDSTVLMVTDADYDKESQVLLPHSYDTPHKGDPPCTCAGVMELLALEVLMIMEMGYAYYDVMDYARAEHMYRESLRLQRDVLGRSAHSHVAEVINYLGICLSTRKGYNAVSQTLFRQAEECLIEAKTMRELVLGRSHVDYATSLNNLGNFYKSALQMTKTHGEDNRSRKFGWGGVLLKTADEVMDLYKESLEIRKTLSPDEMHPHVAQSLNNMALLKSHTLDRPPLNQLPKEQLALEYQQIYEWYNAALTIRRLKLGNNNPDTASTLNNLGNLKFIQVLARADELNIDGRLIGKGGSRIKEVEQESGARVTYNGTKSFKDGAHYSFLGTVDQTATAKLLCESMLKALARNAMSSSGRHNQDRASPSSGAPRPPRHGSQSKGGNRQHGGGSRHANGNGAASAISSGGAASRQLTLSDYIAPSSNKKKAKSGK
ncbi:hypothetical protein DYB32_001777 [Aphanomyces invadans]|uniref:K Homology domain-containing protein n=1 Tax=Aphanomyces invadans TaxID=157072 RepID=A0A3R6W1Z0_9STRA|nr:hypothetical protein DYB32_001777 [Aphanomyces invadans]